MSREEQFMNFPKPHIINLLCDMTDLNDELEAKLQVAVEALENIQFQISVFDKGDEITIAKEALEKIKAK